MLIKACNVPVYSLTDTFVGLGIVGSQVVDSNLMGHELGLMALKIADGVRPEDVPIKELPTVPMVDWRELRRWRISEDRLPPGTIVRFKELTFWQQYQGRILAALGIIAVQFLLIAGLLVERNRKKRATKRLSESEQRFAKTFKANPQPMSLTTLHEGRYLDVNESFLTMSGYGRSDVIGRSSLDLKFFASEEERSKAIVKPLLESGTSRNFETRFQTKSGDFRMLLSSAELIDLGGQKCVVVASTDITERKEAEQQLAELTGRLLRAQDDERRHIARELHDGTAQNIGLLMLNLAQVQNTVSTLDHKNADRLAESVTLGEQALKEIRTLSYVLHPPLLDQAGLVTALKYYIKGFGERSGLKVEFTQKGEDDHRMPPEVEYALFRVVQECLTNILRHSTSDTAEIDLTRAPDRVVLMVRDQGKG